MKKLTFIMLMATMLVFVGCDYNNNNRNLYLPEANNDNVYTTVGGEEKENQTKVGIHQGEGYTISLPTEGYRYEKDYDDGNLEEKWEHITKDDVEIKVTTYKNCDEATARSRFLKDNNDYIFEDLMGYPLFGVEMGGDVLCFDLHQADGNVYIVSWEYPESADEYVKTELSNIAQTFKTTK